MLVNKGISLKKLPFFFFLSFLEVLSAALMENPFYYSCLCCYFLKAVIEAGKTGLFSARDGRTVDGYRDEMMWPANSDFCSISRVVQF